MPQPTCIRFTPQQETTAMSLLTKHPLLVFTLGFAAGFYLHKHRKELIEAAMQGSAKAREAVQKTTADMEELVAFKHH
jgi:hypothetical protein